MSDPTRDTTSPEAIERARVLDFIDRLGELSDEHLMWVLAGARCERRNRNEAEVDTGDEWDPWAELRRREHLDLGWADLPGTTRGLYQVVDRRRVATRKVLLSSRLRDGADRDRTLTHELVHDERRIPTVGHNVDKAEAEAEESVVKAITEERMSTGRRVSTPTTSPKLGEVSPILGLPAGRVDVAAADEAPQVHLRITTPDEAKALSLVLRSLADDLPDAVVVTGDSVSGPVTDPDSTRARIVAEYVDDLGTVGMAGPTNDVAVALWEVDDLAEPFLHAVDALHASLERWADATKDHGLPDRYYDEAHPHTMAGLALARLAELRAALEPR